MTVSVVLDACVLYRLLRDSVANFDNLQLVSRRMLIRRIDVLGDAKLAAACRSLRYAVNC